MNKSNGAWFRSVALAIFVLSSSSIAFATDLLPSSLPKSPAIYLIKGYLDRAPEPARVADEIEINVRGGPARKFLITDYGTPGETPLDLHLSRTMPGRYSLSGPAEEVRRLIEAPAGAQIEGKFLAYTHGAPALVIAELDQPPAPQS